MGLALQLGLSLRYAPTAGGPPDWVPEGAIYHVDFANKQFYVGGETVDDMAASQGLHTGGLKTIFDSDGLLKWNGHNLTTYSDDISGKSVFDGGVANDFETFTFTNATSYIEVGTATVAPKGKYTLALSIHGDTPGDTFDIELVDSADGSDDHTARVTVTSTPTIYTVTADYSGSATFSGFLGAYINRAVSGTSVTAGSKIYISKIRIYRCDLGGMQASGAAGDPTYFPTTSAAYFHLAYDHDPANSNAPLGYLSEAAATNICANFFATGSGTDAYGATSASSLTDLAGETKATKLTCRNIGGTGAAAWSQTTVTHSALETWVTSAFVKFDTDKGTATHAGLATWNFGTIGNRCSYFDLVNGVVGTKSADHAASGIEDYGNGWYRIWIAYTTDNVDFEGRCLVVMDNGTQDTTAFGTMPLDGIGNIHFYGVQTELGSVPSSPIPTNGATVTRTADTLYGLDIFDGFDLSAGTFVTEFENRTFPGQATVFLASAAANADNAVWFFRNGGSGNLWRPQIYSGGAVTGNPFLGFSTGRQAIKASFLYMEDRFAGSMNGDTAVEDNSGAAPIGAGTLFAIGCNYVGGSQLNGTIKSISWYPDTSFSDTELEALSA